MNEKDAYFAGLFDGEACIRIATHNRVKSQPRGATHTVRHDPYIKVSMTHEATVRAIREHFGVGVVSREKTAKAHYLPAWRWVASNRQALAVINRVMPFLVTKQDDAARIILHYAGR